MRFVFLTLGYHPDLTGGAYRYVAEVAEGLASRAHHVAVLCPNPGNGLEPCEVRAGVALHRFENHHGFFALNWLRETASAARLAREIERKSRPDFWVLCHAYLAPVVAARSAQTVVLFTGPWAEEYRFARASTTRPAWRRLCDTGIGAVLRHVERRGLSRAARILTISEYYVAQLPIWHPVRLPSVRMISGGVDAQRFQPASNRLALRHDLGLGPDQFLFLTVRRLDPRMGLLTLIDAFAQVAAEHPQAQLWLAGTGPQQAAIEARISSHSLGGRIRLLGRVPEPDLPALYAAADCAVMPSLDLEGFGLATVEALACGTPVLGSDAGATPELVSPLSPGLLFRPGSDRALADKLRAVLRGELALPGRGACSAYARERFRWEAVVAAFEQTAAELSGPQSPRTRPE
jgi:glycosyltransferase involved in cell wall biosynthesis